MEIEAFAPAKVNLTLHVTGRRADGYHLLDSLVVFAGCGDRLVAREAPGLHLHVTGPRAAGVPADDSNLVLRAARLMGGAAGAALTLEKHLPTAAGIGGGSSDAAATLRALSRLWGRALPRPDQTLALGADLPVCLVGLPARMTGVGESLAALPPLPPLWLVLANPGIAVPTPAIFAALSRRDNPPMPPKIPAVADAGAFAEWLQEMRNDLEAPAILMAPAIAETLAALRTLPGCRLARMSGSGATCFGLFADAQRADHGAQHLSRLRPGWWVQAAPLHCGAISPPPALADHRAAGAP